MKGVRLEWKDINYIIKKEVVVSGFGPCATKEVKNLHILHQLNGKVEPGEMLAIMGPSGSGKTTLLNALSGHIPTKKRQGEISINGDPISRKILKRVTGYVPQDDILFGSQTVYESLFFYAALKLTHLSKDEQKQRVDDLIKELRLTKVRDSIVGYVGSQAENTGLQRGISGGERKRLSIGCQIITNPPLIFLDEPTTGLDSYSAESVIRTLSNQAKLGRTIVFTIHQPSTEIMALFDNLMILAHGKTIYFGLQRNALKYFASIGYKCPKDWNPGDYYVELLHHEPKLNYKKDKVKEKSIDEDKKKKKKQKKEENEEKEEIEDEDKERAYADTEKRSKMLQEAFIDFSKKKNKKDKVVRQESDLKFKKENFPVHRNTLMEAKMLFQRNIGRIIRDPTSLRFGVFQSLFLSLLLGSIFYNLGHTQADIQSRSGGIFFGTIFMMFSGMFAPLMLFSLDREQFLFQNREGLYGPGVYYITKILPEYPPLIIEVFLFCVVFYWLLNLKYLASAFFIFYGFLLLSM